MALNSSLLGQELEQGMSQFNDVHIDTTDPVAIKNYRLQYWTKMADIVINHFKINGVLSVPGAGLNAGQVLVTGQSTTGKIS